ncbi:MAG: N-acetylmuramoyl-L-alanine amidase [Acidimicrobiaceae bacterium]|nr:N-acetylmuramoyl-L-alanine amidase [Acidimicrobiaceae bacterium]MBT6091256.1 N-acetylmuramoyl-L-alanine amidase [Acidimicrobiaceae bacterium]
MTRSQGTNPMRSLLVAACIAMAVVAAGVGTAVALDGAVLGPDEIILPVVARLPGGTIVSSTCGNQIVYDGGSPYGPVDVVLDPGHGGPESGSVGSNGLTERDLNLLVAFHAQLALEDLGYTVALTRRRDLHMPIRQRTAIANALEPQVFVSIHHNGGAVRRSDTPGTETFHQVDDPESIRLAGILFEEVQSVFAPFWVPWVDTVHQGASTRLREPRAETYGILRMTPDLTSVIVEGLYLSNPPEAQLLALPEVQEMEGRAIAAGIHRFLSTSDPGSGFRPEFFDAHTTGTGTARGCVDAQLSPPVEITTGFTTEEHADLAAAARSLGRSTDWLMRFGVQTLKFLDDLPGTTAIVPLEPDARPDAYGPATETIEWNQTDHVVLLQMANAYGVTRTEVQKLGATLMVFLAGLDG